MSLAKCFLLMQAGLSFGARTPYPRTRAVPVLCQCCARGVCRAAPVLCQGCAKAAPKCCAHTPPQTPHSESCVWDGTLPTHLKDVCSKTLTFNEGNSHVRRMSLARRYSTRVVKTCESVADRPLPGPWPSGRPTTVRARAPG